MSLATWIFRYNCKKGDAKRDRDLSTPAEIRRFDNISYGEDIKWQILDVYRPKNESGTLPVIVSAHGGGFVYGDKEVYQFYCMDLAKRGFVVVNFNYRLAPKYKFPAPLEDTNLVFHWMINHAKEYGMDLNHVFLLGDSAGATTAGLYAAMLTNSEYAQEMSFALPDIKISALGLNCGIYSVQQGEQKFFQADIFKKKGSDEEIRQISLIDHVNENFPPCYLLGAYQDILKQEIPALIDKLTGFGIPCEAKVFGDENHPLYHVFHCDIHKQDAKIANDAECDFFRQFIKRKK